MVFWVVAKPTTRWNLLKKRLLEVCPTCTPAASGIYYYMPEFQQRRPLDIFLLKFWCSHDRKGLLHGKLSFWWNIELKHLWRLRYALGNLKIIILRLLRVFQCHLSIYSIKFDTLRCESFSHDIEPIELNGKNNLSIYMVQL